MSKYKTILGILLASIFALIGCMGVLMGVGWFLLVYLNISI
jgi:hypothetical protein